MSDVKAGNKTRQTKRKHIHYALKKLENNTGSYVYVTSLLKKENKDAWGSLKPSTLQTWNNRYPKGVQRDALLTNNPNGYRSRKNKYQRMRDALVVEIARREDKHLLRDRDTMMVWMDKQAKKWVSEGDKVYARFKNSIGFFYDAIEDGKVTLTRVVGTKDTPWDSYVGKREIWLKDVRAFLIEHGYVENGWVLMDLMDYVDEVPITLKGKSRKMCNISNKKECKVLDVPITFDASKRFCTLNPISSFSKVHSVYNILKGSPSKKEQRKYPPSIGWNPDKKAWMNKVGWYGLAKYYRKRSRFLKGGKRCCFYDWYGVHKKYKPEFDDLSKNDSLLFIKGETGNGAQTDQGIGKYFQDFIQHQYYLLQRDYTDRIDRGETVNKFKLSDMRIKVMQWSETAQKAINKRPNFIRSCWRNCLLPMRIDGSEDSLYIAPPMKSRHVMIDCDEILVIGYVRMHATEYKINIPYDIGMIFLRFANVDVLAISANIRNYMRDEEYIMVNDDEEDILDELLFSEESVRRINELEDR
eukprot:527290_1